MKYHNRYGLIIVLIYATVSGLWIAFSDRLLMYLVQDVATYSRFQTLKGWFFIAATSVLLYILIRLYTLKFEDYEKKLKEERDYNRILFDSSPIGLALCRMDGRFVDVNEAFTKITGRSEQEILNLSYWDITPNDYKDHEVIQLDSLRRFGRYGPYEKHYIHKDGHLVPVRLQGILMRFNDEEYIWSSVEDITQLKLSEKKLLESEKKYREVVDNAHNAIFRIDLNGNILFANRYSVEFFGFKLDELIGKSLFETIVPEIEITGRDLRELLKQLLKNPEEYFWNINENRRKNGDRVWFFWVNRLIFDEDGNKKELLCIGTDITALKKTQDELENYKDHLEELVKARTRELEEANEKLKELDRLKSMFIATMSHELRTPLNSIIGFSSVLLNEWLGKINEEQKLNLETINRAGKHLLSLINDIIDISKIEAGLMEVNPEVFDLQELMGEIIRMMGEEIKNKDLVLVNETRFIRLFTDKKRLSQCLINLLSNAIKFTEKGCVRISSFNDLDDEDFLYISIEDSGLGIGSEDLSMLFKPFQRVGNRDSSKIPGTGLGLYLTKKIANDILKGDILVESELGKGSKFTLKIPVNWG